jgi:hypothetical protein
VFFLLEFVVSSVRLVISRFATQTFAKVHRELFKASIVNVFEVNTFLVHRVAFFTFEQKQQKHTITQITQTRIN